MTTDQKIIAYWTKLNADQNPTLVANKDDDTYAMVNNATGKPLPCMRNPASELVGLSYDYLVSVLTADICAA